MPLMLPFLRMIAALMLTFPAGPALPDNVPANNHIRVVSWNISSDAFAAHPEEFRNLLMTVDPDLLLLDEVSATANASQLRDALVGLRPDQNENWHINFGKSGGRQRVVIASRFPLETVSEFAAVVPYPEEERLEILGRMTARDRATKNWNLDHGIPVNAAVATTKNNRLLVLATDLQCCGNDTSSWQEYRRRVEVREIRRRIHQALERVSVDGIILAGDLNVVNSAVPLVLLAGPYPEPYGALVGAELYHADGVTSWTWDGRGTTFSSGVLDYQLYSPHSLRMQAGLVVDSEDLASEVLERYGLSKETSKALSNHRPLFVEYVWK
jgi:exonuclease III